MNEVRKPYIGSNPVMLRHPVHWTFAIGRDAEIDIIVGLGEVAVQPQPKTARRVGDDLQLVWLDRPWRRGGRECDPPHAGRRGIMITPRAILDGFDHGIERLDR